MFDVFASFVYRNRRRVLLVALLGIAVAGVVRAGRREATEPVRRHRPFDPVGPGDESLPGRDADGRSTPASIALVTAGDVHSATAERRVREVEAELRSSRDVATVSSYYDSHDSAMVVPRRTLDLCRRLLPAEVGPENPGRRDALGERVRRPARRRARRRRDRGRAGQHAGRQRPRTRRAVRVPDHLPALAAVLPLARRLAAAAAARRPRDPPHLLRAADRLELHRPVGVRPQHRHRPRARARDRLQPVHGLPLPRGGRSRPASASTRFAGRSQPRAGRSRSAP